MKTIAFFNNKGGVGKTSLVYHLGWMFAERGVATLAVDLDPQSNLTAMFLEEDRLEALWEDGTGGTVFECLKPLIARTGDLAPTPVVQLAPRLNLIPGNLSLSRFEDLLSENWPKCLDGQEAAFRVMTAFHRAIADGARRAGANLVLIDVGPNLGAINRAAMIAAQQVVLPLAPDLFSLQGLKNLGPTLRDWRREWGKRVPELPALANIDAPEGRMEPAGYVVMQHGVRESRPVKAYQRWMDRIPAIYREAVLDESPQGAPTVLDDPHSVALLKHYRSLMPLAMDARKPMFYLKAADGAIGAHTDAVKSCHEDFLRLAVRIGRGAGVEIA
ncbi:MAG: ParA family protein [Acidobacteriota bacterium]